MNFGVICEFNPFHKGHKYLIDSVKSQGDRVICCMSGNFVQREEPAIFDKYQRCLAALQNGADLVIELPTLCSTQSAQGFAAAGVKLLESLEICDKLCFGSESGDLDALKQTVRDIAVRDDEIKAQLATGVSYPVARRNAVDSPLLDTPNDILAIEYLSHTKLDCLAIQRIGGGHDSDDDEYSASRIRSMMDLDAIHSLKHCEDAVLYKLRSMRTDDYARIDDVSEGLENRIVNAVRTSTSLEEIYGKIKTKRYTMSRIRRIILRAFLGITEDMPKEPQYIRVLGFTPAGQELLNEAKRKASLPIITRYGDADGNVRALYDLECAFTDIYSLTASEPLPCGNEQRAKIVTI